jgi:DDE superfamily endonuclease/Homeodomain-like domain
VHYQQQGFTRTEIAHRVGCSLPTVRKWLQRHNNKEPMTIAPKSGRKRVLTEASEQLVLNMLTDGNGSSAQQVSKQLCADQVTTRSVHKTTLIRAAKRAASRQDKKLWVRKGQPFKGLTQATQQKRLAFARANLNTDWRKVMFSDRKKFHFRYPGSKVKPSQWQLGAASSSSGGVNQPNHPQCVNLYCGMCRHGVTVVHVVAGSSKHTSSHTNKQGKSARNITTGEYKEVLQQTLLPGGKKLFTTQGISTWVLQQDNDPTHRCAAAELEQYNKDNASSVQLLKPWPPSSPDLNPIENLWAWVQREVDQKGCNSYEELEAAVIDTIAAVPKQHLVNLCDSMPKRLQAVVEKQGDLTKY